MSPLVRHTLSAALALSFNLLPAANAAVITENFSFSGADFGNGATATGYIIFDTATYTANGFSLSLGDVKDISVTVAGAVSGNGTFGKADFASAFIWTVTDVDWSQPLMGAGGWSGPDGGFKLYASAPAPSMTDPAAPFYILYSGGGLGSPMRLTSLAQAAPVPEPETYMLLGIASAALAWSRRRTRKQRQGTAELQPSSLLAA
mgnify:CR=1 FL=1